MIEWTFAASLLRLKGRKFALFREVEIILLFGFVARKGRLAPGIETTQASDLDLGRNSDQETPFLSSPKACDEKEDTSTSVVGQEKGSLSEENGLPSQQLVYVQSGID